jgi:hypothetical protein
MAAPADEAGGNQSVTLLAEILEVLKNIDGRLVAQDNRLHTLEDKVTALTPASASPLHWISDTRNGLPGLSTTSAEYAGIESFSPLNSAPQRRELQQRPFRKASVESRGPRDSVSSSIVRGRKGLDQQHSRTSHDTGNRRSISLGPGVMSPDSFKKSKALVMSGTWNSLEAHSRSIGKAEDEDQAYHKFLPPSSWISNHLGGELDVKFSSAEAEALWQEHVGDSWRIPPDGRVEMTFQRHLLERMNEEDATSLLKTLDEISLKLEYQQLADSSTNESQRKRGSFRVSDFGFDPNFEESSIEYRAEVTTGKYKDIPISRPKERPASLHISETGNWKRMMY